MSEVKALAARIEKLEVQVAYQDQTIEELNKALSAQWEQFDRLKRDISRLSEQLHDVQSSSQNEETPPPHY